MSEIIQVAKRRIREVRQKEVELLVLKGGKPVSNAGVSIRMRNHEFLFGAICYKYGTYKSKEMNDLFSEEFVKLFNYTMIPFHWGEFEPKKHQYREPYTRNLINWAKAHNIKRKMHAIIWHEVCPDWVTYEDDVKELYRERIEHLMINYGDDFDFFDLANETTVNDRFENPVSKWVREFGPMNMLKFGTRLVRSYKPDAKLIYGDWNVHVDEYYNFLKEMRENDIDIDIIGIQSHMHRERWTFEEALQIMDRAAAFGWPIHFPECSICSGRPIGVTSYAPGGGKTNRWSETEEDLYWQAEYAKDFYTLVFSHPAVELLNWFDFTDHHWLGAPAGIVTDDLKIKPVYNTLYDLIHREWHTDADLSTGTNGLCRTRLFFGNYDITIDINGEKTTVNQDILRKSFYTGDDEPRRLVIKL